MSKLRRASLTFGVILGIPILIVAVFIGHGLISHQALKHNLEQEVGQLAIPPGCTKNYGYYQAGGFGSDIATHFQQEYKCNVAGGIAYEAIVTDLVSHGYHLVSDESLPHKSPLGSSDYIGLAYSFIYASKQFTASYDFHPNQPSCCSLNGLHIVNPNDLANIQVTGISLRLE